MLDTRGQGDGVEKERKRGDWFCTSHRTETEETFPWHREREEFLSGLAEVAPGLCSSSACSQVRHLPVGIKMKQSSPSRAALMASSWFVRKQCKPNFRWNTVIISSEWENFVPLKRCSAGLFTSGSSSRRKGTCGE